MAAEWDEVEGPPLVVSGDLATEEGRAKAEEILTEIAAEALLVDPSEIVEFEGEEPQQFGKTKYKCRGCGYISAVPWNGEVCPGCGRYYNMLRSRRSRYAGGSILSSAQLVAKRQLRPFSTTVRELDQVLAAEGGMGIYPDSCILFGGAPSTGKTTLLLQVADGVAQGGAKVVFASGEMAGSDLGRYLGRLGIENPNITVIGLPDGSRIEKVKAIAEDIYARMIIVDSAQTVYFEEVDGDAGSPSQIRALGNSLNDWVKTKRIAVLLVCQLNKGVRNFAGGAGLQYLVDALVFMDDLENEFDESTKGLRELAIGGETKKNRLGPNDVTATIRLTPKGFVSVKKKRRGEGKLYVPEDIKGE